MVIVGIEAIALVIDALIWLLFGQLVIGPWMDEQFNGKRPWWKKALMLPVHLLEGKVKRLMHRIVANFSSHFVAAEPAVGRFVHRLAVNLEQLSGVIVSSNQATYQTFVYIRHTMVPTLIERAVAPLRTQITNIRERVNGLEDRNRQVSNLIAQTLRHLPWGVGGDYVPNFRQWLSSYEHLWDQVTGPITTKLNALYNVRVPQLERRLQTIWDDLYTTGRDSLHGIRLRIGRIEDAIGGILDDPTTWVLGALGLAMLPALTPTGMRTALRNLTCRNTQTLARNVCAMDEALLAELLAGTLLFAMVIDPRAVIAAGDEVAGLMGEAFRVMADV